MIRDRPLIYLALAQIVTWSGLYYLFPALLIAWEQDLGWSKRDLTAAITIAIFASALAAPYSGKFIDAGKGPLLMTGSTVFGGICLYLLSYVSSLTEFYLIWGLIGVCLSGCLYEPCFALVTRSRGQRAKQGIILITLIAGFASTISFPVAHSLVQTYDWSTAIRIFAAAVILIGSPLMWLGASSIENTREISAENSGSVEKPDKGDGLVKKAGVMKNPVFWMLGAGFALAAVLHGVTLHHLLPMLNERGVHPDVAVTIISFIGPMQIAGRLAMVASANHVTNHGIATSCFMVLSGSVILLMVAGQTLPLLIGFIILFGGGYGMVSIIRPVIAREIMGEKNFGAKSGALALLYLIGAGSAPYIGSLIWDMGGYKLVLEILVVLGLLGFGLYFSAHKVSSSRAK